MSIGKLAAGAAVSAAGMAAVVALSAAPASAASGWNVDAWNDHCNYTGAYGCLYYSPNGSGGIFKGYGYYRDLSGYKFSNGSYVRNNAASIGNYTTNCGSTTWVYAGSGGNWNWVRPLKGGNLNSYLRNNENSFDATASCT